jgi:hypothetical protein
MINTTTIEIYTVEEWQNNWEALIERVENGENIGIKNEKTGQTAVMILADDEIVKIHTILNNDAS